MEIRGTRWRNARSAIKIFLLVAHVSRGEPQGYLAGINVKRFKAALDNDTMDAVDSSSIGRSEIFRCTLAAANVSRISYFSTNIYN